MVYDSHPVSKRPRLAFDDPMKSETAETLLEAAKERFGRVIRVFEISSLASKVTNDASSTDEAEEFYEFTAEDYYRMLSSKREDKHLKTKKLREAEEAARRLQITKAVIRVRFPDDIILESTFHPSEPIQSLMDLLKKTIAQPHLPFYLYTTPPKMQIKDVTQDFYSAGFVPGAIVYFSYDPPKGNNSTIASCPYLREDVLSLKGLDIKAGNAEAEAAEEITRVSPFPSEFKSAAKKNPVKPKWMKL